MSGLPGEYDFSLYQGDTCSFSLTYTEGAVGAEVGKSLDGAVLEAHLRQKKTDPSFTAVFDVTADPDQITNPGLMTVSLDAANSSLLVARRYYWDLEITWPNAEVQTILAGIVSVTQDVTK